MRFFLRSPDPKDATKGQVFSCSEGHPMCEALRDTVIGGEENWNTAFGNWIGMSDPKDGEPWPRCPTCQNPLSLNGWTGETASLSLLSVTGEDDVMFDADDELEFKPKVR